MISTGANPSTVATAATTVEATGYPSPSYIRLQNRGNTAENKFLTKLCAACALELYVSYASAR